MKASTISLTRMSFTAALALASVLAFALPVKSLAADTPKGGERLIELGKPAAGKPINTVGDMEDVKPGDQMVMSCPKCKSVSVTTVIAGKGGYKETKTVDQHLCPGCKTAFETVGTGKAKTDKVVHKCAKCGSEDAFCCVVKQGAGPTAGMK